MDTQKELGLTFAQYALLSMITKEKRSRVIHLAEKMEVKSSAVTVMLDRLEILGLVSRETDENDRRAVVVTITEKGQSVQAEGKCHSEKMLSQLLSILEPDELQRFADYFTMVDRQER